MTENPLIYDTPAAMAAGLASRLVADLFDGRPHHIAVSGGSTPRALFQALAKEAHRDWSHIHLYWVDERCVAPDHADSNYRMTHETLLAHVPIPETNVHRMRGEAEPELEARRYSYLLDEILPKVAGLPVFDFVLLGMGADGHTASIFPGNLGLFDMPADVADTCRTAVHPESGQRRVTLTGQVINHSQVIIFHVTGADKADKVKGILTRQPGAEVYPAAHVQAAHPEGKLIWYLDQAAASQL
ncbi:MAG: 6-phosphogluconolactonase [Bacteroidia bacterium]|nr:6-phosphogluconolactonase [Bacteroidia bacterium]